jgi:glycosyltransferase involved in cell wall biosynthesis
MANIECGAVVIARDEEDVIERCLESLRNQKVKLFLVVVNDGSGDRTGEIALNYADVVVDLDRHEESWAGKPELARVFNTGFKVLAERDVEYILVSGADAVYPTNYVEEMIQNMNKDDIMLSSGVAQGENVRDDFPRGCGRFIQSAWFKKNSFQYPEKYGFEAYPIFKALSQGENVKVYRDLDYMLQRETRFSNRKMYTWGKGMRALNYWGLYAIGRAAKMGLRHPLRGFWLLKGYFSKTPAYEDVSVFVPDYQKKMVKEMLRRAILGNNILGE